ncbi:MAG: right-handed parallel beta-helix repeat-containing protein [Myxococcaceae bacterium]|nr:right-handed parallel beta-helix repeat-containing protein [Myxococcaceae bacterium]
MRRILQAVAVVLISACEGPATHFEGKSLAKTAAAVADPAAVEPAHLAVLTPCPPGWSETSAAVSDGPVTCEPWPGGAPEPCGVSEANFVGQPACARIGTVCPAGDFPEGVSGFMVRYVRAGASAGGNGTLAAPFQTVGAALVNAAPGTIVAIAKGTYDEAVRVPAGVTLWGACVAQTTLTSSTSHAIIGTVTPLGAGVTVRNLTVSGERPGVVVGVPTATAVIEDVAVLRTKGFGIVVANGAQATARSVLVRNVGSATQGGDGFHVEGGGTLTLAKVVVEQIVGLGIVAFGDGSRVEGSQVAILHGVSTPDGLTGSAIETTLNATVTVHEFAFEGNEAGAVYAATGGKVSLTDGVVRDTQPRTTDLGLGNAIAVLKGGRVETTRTTLDRNHSISVYVADSTASVQLTDTVVRETLPEKRSGEPGFGLVVMSGGRAEVARLTVQNSRGNGVSVHLPGSTLVGTDLTVLDTRELATTKVAGDGVSIARGATAQLTRVRLERNRASGLIAGGPGTSVEVADLTVRSTSADLSTRQSFGLGAQEHARITVRRALVEQNQQVGVVVNGAVIDAEDLVVRDTRGEGGDGPVGRGVHVQQGGQLVVRRGLFENNREAGISAINANTVITLEDVVVQKTRRRDCVPRCADEGGSGMASLGGAHIAARRFVITSNVSCGVELGDLGTMDLTQGMVSDNPIGVCMSSTGFDVNRLDQEVVYLGNASKLSADFFPVPSFTSPPNQTIDPPRAK